MVGASQTKFGDFPDRSIKELFVEAYTDLIESIDKGCDPRTIDAAYIGTLGVGGFQLGQSAPLLTGHVGLPHIPTVRVENACASGSLAIVCAARAIALGECDVVLAGGIEKMRDMSATQTKYWLGVSGDTEYERLAGMTFAGIYALMANRYMHEYPLERKHLSMIAVKNHRNGAANPKAQFQKEITLETAMNSPSVASPLGLFDCCSITDGAALVLLAAADRSHEFTDHPIHLLGWGTGSDYLAVHDRQCMTSLSAVVAASKRAYTTAGVAPSDIDVAEVHDCFSIAEVMAYEDLGFCERGMAHRAIEDGRFTLGGSLPVNPSGGLKAKGHPVGATGVSQAYEVFQQLRASADKPNRQVCNPHLGLTHNVGGSGGSAVVIIYGNEGKSA